MPRILGIDPGGTTGYCLLQTEAIGNPKAQVVIHDVGEVPFEKFHRWLDELPTDLTHVVCEDWIQRPEYAEGRWIKQPVAKQVGAVWHRALLLGAIYIELQPRDKPEGYRLAKLRYVKGKKGTHVEDATAHAMYVAKLGFKPSQRKG